MSLFQSTDKQREYAIAFLRIVVGVIFVAHGAQKLFGYGLEGTIGAFGQMGIPFAGVIAPLIVALEFFGGIALIAGFLTRLVGIALVADMLGAIGFVHLKGGFFMPAGYEFALILLIAALGFAIAGSGAISVDSVLANRRKPLAARIR